MNNFTRSGVFAGAIALSTLGSASIYSSISVSEAKPYLLKVSNVAEAAQLVENVGGSITDTAVSISYLGARLTEEQLQVLSRSSLVVRIAENEKTASQHETDSVAGNWWDRNNTVAGNWWDRSNTVAGNWWDRSNTVAGNWWDRSNTVAGNWWDRNNTVAGNWWDRSNTAVDNSKEVHYHV